MVSLSAAVLALLIITDQTRANVLHSISYVTDHPIYSIVLIQTKSAVQSYRFGQAGQAGNTVYVELGGVTPGDQRPEISVNEGALRRIRVDYNRSRGSTQVLIDVQPGVLTQGVVHRKLGGNQVILLIDLPQGQTRNLPSEEEAKRLRQEGKRIVIIDPGHGWLDPGCQYNGMQEKTVCLDIGRKLAALINKTADMRAYLTRDGDYLPVMNKDDYSGSWKQIQSKSLSARLEFARRMHGQVFVSLHLNTCRSSLRRPYARGFEIYHLGVDNSQSVYQDQIDDIDPSDLEAFTADLPESGLDPEVGRLLLSIQRDVTTVDTAIFVDRIKDQLLKVPGLVPRDPPIKPHGRLRVLQTLAMPSALVELAFLSNTADARLLAKTDFRWKLAQALCEGIAEFFKYRMNGGLSPGESREVAKVSIPDEEYDIHVVKRDETLFSIAQTYGTDASTLQRINAKGRSTVISPGEEIKVPRPGPSPSTQPYTVRTGDNLREIARRHGTTESDLKRINRLDSSTVRPGDKLYVPLSALADGPPPASPAPVRKVGVYKVRRGDSLFEIARRYRTSVSNLKALNGLKSNTIQPGQTLRVPMR
jgi:N-acetylmuramoyl-L-alanine amidase/LysM repeat protein